MTDGGRKLRIRLRHNSLVLVLYNIDRFVNLITSMIAIKRTTSEKVAKSYANKQINEK